MASGPEPSYTGNIWTKWVGTQYVSAYLESIRLNPKGRVEACFLQIPQNFCTGVRALGTANSCREGRAQASCFESLECSARSRKLGWNEDSTDPDLGLQASLLVLWSRKLGQVVVL